MTHHHHAPPPGFFVLPGFGDAPVGAVIAFAGKVGTPNPATASPPDPVEAGTEHVTQSIEAWGWMLCDGRTLCTQQYPELFAALGYQYGGQDNQFCIPDYRGYFLRGNDDGSGNDPDVATRTDPAGGTGKSQEVGSVQNDALQTHEHAYRYAPAPATPSQSGSAAGATTSQEMLTDKGPTDSLNAPPGKVQVSKYETRPKNISVYYLVKFTYGLLQTAAASY